MSMEQLSGDGAYLMDNGRLCILWLGRNIASGYIGELFAADPGALPQDLAGLSIEPEKPTSVSMRLCACLRSLRKCNSGIYQQCFVVRQVVHHCVDYFCTTPQSVLTRIFSLQGSAMEAHAIPYFVEDRGQGTQSYTDFLCTIHKGVSIMAK